MKDVRKRTLGSCFGCTTSTLHTLALIGHIVGVAFGVGGATATDMVFVRCLRLRHIDQTLATVLELASKLVTAGMVLLTLSGIVLIRTGTHTSERFWAKMVVVIVVAANGACAHWFTFPRRLSLRWRTLVGS